MSSPDDLHHIDDYLTSTGQQRWRVRMRLTGGRRPNRSFTSLEAAQKGKVCGN